MMNRKMVLVACALLSLIALPPAARAGNGGCVDPAVTVSIATYPGTPQSNLYFGAWGDGVVADPNIPGNTFYKDGASGVYAKFQVCNSTNDLILNLLQARGRTVWWNWGHNVGACNDLANCVAPPAWTATPQNSQSFFNVDEVFTLSVGKSFTTWISGNLTAAGVTYGARWRNPNATWYSDSPNPYLDIINEPYPTALVQVARNSCSQYTVQAIPGTDSTGATPFPFPVATLLAPAGKNSMVNAGQYEMPISLTVQLLAKTPLDPDPSCRP